MKKTLLLFAMLLGVVGAWAQAVFPEEGKYYVIKNFRSSKYATFMYGDNVQLKQKANPTANAIWYVTEVATLDGGGISCKLHNAATESIYAANNSFTATGATVYIKENPYKTGYVCVSTTENLSSNCWDDADRSSEIGSIGNYNPRPKDYDGTSWTFVDVTDQVETATAQYSFTDPLGQVISGSYKRFTLGEDYTVPAIILNMGVTLSNAVFENNTLSADIVYPFPVSNEEVTNKLMINGYEANSLNFKFYTKDNTYVKVFKNIDPTADNISNYLWAIYPNLAEGTYTIKNIATNKYVYTTLTTGNGIHNETALSFNETATPFKLIRDNWGYSFKVATETLYLSINSSQSTGTPSEQYVGLHGNTHAGSSLSFIPYVIKYTLTDMAGGVHTGEYEGWSNLQPELPTFTGAEGYRIGEKTWGNGTVSANINFGLTVSSETKVNQLVISIGENANRKWIAKKNSNNGEMYVHITSNDGTPELGTGQWAIYPILNGTQFGFKIKNIATDTYVYAKPDNTGVQPQPQGFVDNNKNSNPVILKNEGTIFEMVTPGSSRRFKYTSEYNNGTTLYLTVNGSSSYNCPLGVWNSTHNNTDYENVSFPDFNEYKITIGSTGYTTLYSPFTAIIDGNIALLSGLQIYTITSAPKDGRVNLNLITNPQAADVSNYIYENQGVIIKGNPDTYTFRILDDENYYDAEDWKNNLLEGSVTNTYVQGDAYVLSAPDGVESVGLYKALLNKDANGESGDTHFKNNAGKAYLPASALTAEAAESRFFLFSFGDDMETGITETENGNVKTENTEVYDLSGRRVQGAQKGIFIVNGKKVVR